MDEATIALTIMTGLLLASFAGFLIWGIRTGQFKNTEGTKYQIFGGTDEDGKSPPQAKSESREVGGGAR